MISPRKERSKEEAIAYWEAKLEDLKGDKQKITPFILNLNKEQAITYCEMMIENAKDGGRRRQTYGNAIKKKKE